MNETDKIRSKAINDLLNEKPGSLVRYGPCFICSLIILGLFCTTFIKYPATLRETVITKADTLSFYKIFFPHVNDLSPVKGDRILLKFNDHPLGDYKTIQVPIISIDSCSLANYFVLKVELPNNLIKSTGISSTEGVIVQAEIILKDKRLSDKLLDVFKTKKINLRN